MILLIYLQRILIIQDNWMQVRFSSLQESKVSDGSFARDIFHRMMNIKAWIKSSFLIQYFHSANKESFRDNYSDK